MFTIATYLLLFSTSATALRIVSPNKEAHEARTKEVIADLKYSFKQVFSDQKPFLELSAIEIEQDPKCKPTHIVCISKTLFAQGHLAHAAEKLLPCWSLFQRYPRLLRVIMSEEIINIYENVPWTQHLLHAMKAEVRLAGQTVSECKVTGVLPKDGGGWNADSGYPTDLTNKFLIRSEDAVALQDEIGLNTSMAGQSIHGYLKIGIVNRHKTRRWVGSSTFIQATKQFFPNATVTEVVFDNMTASNQAKWMNEQDIVVSPHGAQLTNLIWARHCIGVVELFPQHYYIPGFFGALASVIGGVAFAGYPEGRDGAADTWGNPHFKEIAFRDRVRSLPVQAEPRGVARFLIQVAAQQQKCARAQMRE